MHNKPGTFFTPIPVPEALESCKGISRIYPISPASLLVREANAHWLQMRA